MTIETGVGRSRHGYCRDGLVNATEVGKGHDKTGTRIATAYLSLSERDGNEVDMKKKKALALKASPSTKKATEESESSTSEEDSGADISTSLEEIVRLWLLEVGMVFLLVGMSRGERRELSLGVRIRVSSRPQHPRVLPILRLHSRLSWRLRLRCQFPRLMTMVDPPS
ncbi:hypothetical protein Taro_016629 [Colocasia esculenta]|uniref:Uncharacterized protein n=1 Tax=Colocasia esculenta TaxID=4460 RepID=A0A843UPA0_COLES|nr:hypothetical protein [Colocasia esculenta]